MRLVAVAAAALVLALPASARVVARTATLIAAGDIADCTTTDDERTAALVAGLRGTVAVLGDTVYQRGTDDEYRRCYAPSWGRARGRTRPAVGNHEYLTPGAAGYFRYFGRRAGPTGKGWYAYGLGAWRVVVLNTNCSIVGCGRVSRQYRWLRAELARHPARCTLAYGHHPRFSSGLHGDDRTVLPLWRLLYAHGADVVLAGHDHDYERFVPMTPDGRLDPRRGIREFVVGTGGRRLYPVFAPRRGSRVRNDRVHGVLVLRLLSRGYRWRFAAVRESGFRDSGAAWCH